MADVLDRIQRSGLARSERQSGNPALESRDAFFEDAIRRVHDAGVNVAELGQSEQVGGMRGVAEQVARRPVDRYPDGGRRRLAPVARMERERFRMLALGRHLDLYRECVLNRHSAVSEARGQNSIRSNRDDVAFK